METVPPDISRVLIELGAAIGGFGILARLASRWGFSSVPLYLLGGLAFGNGGLLPLKLSQSFTQIGGEIGLLLLLFMLGLEYTGRELTEHLHGGMGASAVDFLLNFIPGVAAGILFGWSWLPALVLGGVTRPSSWGVIVKVLTELKRLGDRETPPILSILVLEDLAMAAYLPLVTALLSATTVTSMVVSILVAAAVVLSALVLSLRYGQQLSRWVSHESDEVVLLTVLALVLLDAGVAERAHVSAAVAAFLAGVAFSGPIAENRVTCLPRFETCSRQSSFSFSGWRLRPPAFFRSPDRQWVWA
jgi:monovalent cation:H+ antiporter-2, CPA2 family